MGRFRKNPFHIVNDAVVSGSPVVIKTVNFPREAEEYLTNILEYFLNKAELSHIQDRLGYCLKELISNAVKANAKRVFFYTKGMNIKNDLDYTEGMSQFRDEVFNNISYYSEKLRDMGFYVKLYLCKRGNTLQISVRNNSELMPTEEKRLLYRIKNAHSYSSMQEAFEEIIDYTEGSGLGIVTIILMLKELGMSEKDLDVRVENGETYINIFLKTGEVEGVTEEEFVPYAEEA